MGGTVFSRTVAGAFAFGRYRGDRSAVRGPVTRGPGDDARRLLDDQMRVGAAEPEGTDSGDSWRRGLVAPRFVVLEHPDAFFVEPDVFVQLFEIRLGGELSMSKHLQDFQQSRDARHGFGVTDVPFDTADANGPDRRASTGKHLIQGGQFDR